MLHYISDETHIIGYTMDMYEVYKEIKWQSEKRINSL